MIHDNVVVYVQLRQKSKVKSQKSNVFFITFPRRVHV